MRVILLYGSPHKYGSSNTLTEIFLEGLTSQKEFIITRYYLNELDIHYCHGCLYCATSENHTCKIQDDMQPIYADFKRADLVVIATPMYWGYMTGIMKVTFDRFESLAWEGLYGKLIVAIITYHNHYESFVSFFERIAPHFHLTMHYLICCTLDKKIDKDIHVNNFPENLEEAYELGTKIGLY